MIKTNKLIISILTLLTMGCSNKPASGNIDDIEAGILAFPGSDAGDAAAVLDTINFIPLNESDSALLSNTTKMMVFSGHYYILDRFAKNVIAEFDENGDFVRRIGKRGESGMEYSHAWDFDVDSTGVYVYDNRREKIIRYSLDGEFVDSRKTGSPLKGFAKTKNGFILGVAKDEGKSEENEILVTDSSLNVIATYLPFRESYQDDRMTDNLFRKVGDRIVYHRPVNDGVYVFDDYGNVTEELKVSFGDKEIPEYMRDSYQRFVHEKGKEKYNYAYDSPIYDGNYVVCSIFINGNKGTAVYDFKTNSFHVKEMNPIFSSIMLSDILFPMAYSDKAIYTILEKPVIDVLRDKASIPDNVKKHLDDGNKVICVYQLK